MSIHVDLATESKMCNYAVRTTIRSVHIPLSDVVGCSAGGRETCSHCREASKWGAFCLSRQTSVTVTDSEILVEGAKYS